MERWWIPNQADNQDHYNPDGRIRWFWLELGGAAIMLQEFLPARHPKEMLGTGVNICFQCEDALAREFKPCGIQTRRRPFVGPGMSKSDPRVQPGRRLRITRELRRRRGVDGNGRKDRLGEIQSKSWETVSFL